MKSDSYTVLSCFQTVKILKYLQIQFSCKIWTKFVTPESSIKNDKRNFNTDKCVITWNRQESAMPHDTDEPSCNAYTMSTVRLATGT